MNTIRNLSCSSGGEAVLRNLLLNDCTVCFTNPGTSEMHFCAALDDVPEMRSILVLFEGVASGACLGYGIMADKPSACLMHLSGGYGNGYANLHNAKRSAVPVIVICGDHATDHQYDQHLQGDITQIASGVSGTVVHNLDEMALVRDLNDCIRGAYRAPGNVATLILPANASWNKNPPLPVKITNLPKEIICTSDKVMLGMKILKEAMSMGMGSEVLLLHGLKTARKDGLIQSWRIAEATKCGNMLPTFNGKVEYGWDIPQVNTIPYFAEQQVQLLSKYKIILLVNAKHPAGFFGYPEEANKPGWVLPDGCQVVELASVHDDGIQYLTDLANALNAPVYMPSSRAPPVTKTFNPNDNLNPKSIGIIMSKYLPEEFVMVDEGNTMGGPIKASGQFYNRCHYDQVALVGGAIGQGLPVSVGVGVAVPDKKVINLQADGSAMYTIQSLWTMAREKLDVCVVICDNGVYGILAFEHSRMTGKQPGNKAMEMFDLSMNGENIDFVQLAKGMGVDGAKCFTDGEFEKAFQHAMSTKGPYLIQAVARRPKM